ncbi:amidohydrolase family protein [Lacibacter sediminis]|uniref:Amidohydrolase family protein n=1 Tax=Lacibacter sediminis TaxID=2760713 RepID=A0A7G5XFY2_9BACT|nr:amidohydrolase family protein [Lacibacter sediminis]QNA44385.1 amidohydrolase family protein [Lacibacter sediminis]
MRFFLLIVCIFTKLAVLAQVKSIRFINGQWFNGKEFVAAEFYSVNGLLTKSAPSSVDTVVDLKQQYIIPAFGEAHNHSPETDQDLDVFIERYVADGIFYIKNPNSIPFATNKIQSKINHPRSVDVIYANGGLTANGGHPTTLYNYMLGTTYKKALPGWTTKSFEGEAYYLINSKEELEKKWPFVLSQKPGFIKFYLIFSEEYEERKDDTLFNGKKGIDPKLAKLITKKAHAAGLKVSAHAETPSDLQVALAAGVDEINHLPGYQVRWRDGYTEKYYKLTAKIARSMKRKGVHVDPTYSLLQTEIKPMSNQQREAQTNVQKENLLLLKKYRVPVTVGCDSYNLTAQTEIEYLRKLNIYSNLELLKMWCEVTPAAIFPNRKIGKLQEGYEASFLILSKNPLENFEHAYNISLRVKQGVILW